MSAYYNEEAEETHEHCVGCECVLRWDENENYCRWCEERMEKEAKNECLL